MRDWEETDFANAVLGPFDGTSPRRRHYVQVTEIGKPCGPPRDATSRKPQGQAGAVRFNGTKCKPGPDLFIYVPEWLQT
jgi:hypothetical protein